MDSGALAGSAPLQNETRPPPKGVTLLLPVWGYRFITQFLDFGLPTLLAPGNIPAMAAMLPTRFVVLSREADEELICSHPSWIALQKICPVEVAYIDDLITADNHTTTITLAFARAVREAGEAMTDTGFVFLMSDYLFADGALRTVASRFLDGASAILAGNFQIVAEEAMPAFESGVDPVSRAIILPSRDLVAWSLRYLHPATTANMVNFGLSHNAHANRLLWRVDENTLIGRFYLIHPFGVRPEVTDFIVGSSFDYSFVPEMCPSGNVVTLTDSDDYFVVEMQPRRHEQSNLRPGPIDEAELAMSLSEWTTAQHRANVGQTIIYHASEMSVGITDAVAEADAFIDRVAARLPATPQPFRGHPYWAGAIASNRLRTGRALDKEDWAFLLRERKPVSGLRAVAWFMRQRLFGAGPEVTRMHGRWPDYKLPRQMLQKVVSENGRLLLVTDRPDHYAHWMTGVGSEVYTLEWNWLLDIRPGRFGNLLERNSPLLDSFDACLVGVTDATLERAGTVIQRISPLVKASGRISVMVLNDRPYNDAAAFSTVFAHRAAEVLSHAAWLTQVHYVPASRLRWRINRGWDGLWRRAREAYLSQTRELPLLGLGLVALGILNWGVNRGVRPTSVPPKGLWSSVFLMLRRSQRDTRILWQEQLVWTSKRISANPHPEGDVAPSGVGPLTVIQAAHSVAAKLLAGRHDVAIYGLDETDGPQIAMYNVLQLTIYAPGATDNSGHRRMTGIAVGPLRFHDILDGPLPQVHDAICCLRTMGYVGRADEDCFVDNLAQSLSRTQDILLLGSVAAETEASGVAEGVPSSGHFYSRTGPQLKALAERFFESVLLFSIADGELHPGSLATAEYVLVICCRKKDTDALSRPV
ncbi:MAG TPA: hypothetical protein VNV38_01805 [Stellaceae bacterium]|jgi:hypothetical protein|nr:hypothetical protein [Stellaceae bacterium]